VRAVIKDCLVFDVITFALNHVLYMAIRRSAGRRRPGRKILVYPLRFSKPDTSVPHTRAQLEHACAYAQLAPPSAQHGRRNLVHSVDLVKSKHRGAYIGRRGR